MDFNNKQFKLGRFFERAMMFINEFDTLPEKVEFINNITQEFKIDLKHYYLEHLFEESFNDFDERIYNSIYYYLVPEMDCDSIATRNFDDTPIQYVIYVENNKLVIIDGNEKDELIKKIEDDEPENILNINELYMIANFGGKRFAMLRTDCKRIKEIPDLFIDLHRIHNDSTPGNIIMTEIDMKNPCGEFNPSTKKLRMFK